MRSDPHMIADPNSSDGTRIHLAQAAPDSGSRVTVRHQNTAGRERRVAADFHRSGQIDHSPRTDRGIIANGKMAEPLQDLNEHRFVDPDPVPYRGAEQVKASRA